MKQKILLSGLFLITLLTACQNQATRETASAKQSYCLAEDFDYDVEMMLPKVEPIIKTIPLTGIVKANPDKVIQFMNLVDGIIVHTQFSLGDYVKKGQVLAKLKSTELSEWASQREILSAKLKVVQENYKAEKALYEDGISSQKALFQAKSEVQEITSELKKIEDNLALYDARTENGVFLIKAPSAGYITEKNVAAGMHVSAYGDPLFTISELDEVWIQVNIYASNMKEIQEGMEVEVHALSAPEQSFYGKIDAISQIIDPDANVLKARVVLKNENLSLKPGMFVDVTAQQKLGSEALAIPTNAIIFDDNQSFIVTYQDDCHLSIHKVEALSQNNSKSYISGTIPTGQQVIVKNQLLIYEQLKNFKS